MEYRRFDHTIVARLDKGEEILEQVKTIALQEHITLATVQALGAINAFTGHFEIVSLSGTINTMDGDFYSHLHMSAGNEKGQVFGGHLNRAIISATCEMVITILDGTVDRKFDPDIGLNLFDFQ